MLFDLLLAIGLLIFGVFVAEWLVRRNKSGARLWGDVSQMCGALFYFLIFSLALLFPGFRWVAVVLVILSWWLFRTKSKDVATGSWRRKVNDA